MTKSESYVDVCLLYEMFVLTKDGRIIWKSRPSTHFRSSENRGADHICANWNARYAGSEAISCLTPSGHKTGRINDKMFYAHRIIWAMQTGSWPKNEIDHVNGNPTDNRIENLRDVPHKINLRNQGIRKNNTSGLLGVRFYRPRNKWSSSIQVNGKSIHIGYFETKQEAAAARIAANTSHGFHENHGRMAT